MLLGTLGSHFSCVFKFGSAMELCYAFIVWSCIFRVLLHVASFLEADEGVDVQTVEHCKIGSGKYY